MAKGKNEENNPKRRPRRPGAFVPKNSPIRDDEREMRRNAGNSDSMSTDEQMDMADEALRERPRQTRYLHDKDDDYLYNEDY